MSLALALVPCFSVFLLLVSALPRVSLKRRKHTTKKERGVACVGFAGFTPFLRRRETGFRLLFSSGKKKEKGHCWHSPLLRKKKEMGGCCLLSPFPRKKKGMGGFAGFTPFLERRRKGGFAGVPPSQKEEGKCCLCWHSPFLETRRKRGLPPAFPLPRKKKENEGLFWLCPPSLKEEGKGGFSGFVPLP